MNATGRVNSPISISDPPITSSVPASPSCETRVIGGMPAGIGGWLNSFIVPKVMNTRAATMRRTLNILWGHGEGAGSKIDMSGAPRVVRGGHWRVEKIWDHLRHRLTG